MADVGQGTWGSGGVNPATGAAAIPSGSKIVLQKDGYTVYQDPSTGQKYVIEDATGETPRGYGWGSSPDIAHHVGTADIRGGTDSLGITTPDPSKTPEGKALADAAHAFGSFYQQDRANADASRGMDIDTIARLRAAEEGKTPSAAEALMRKTIDQNASQALGLAATLGGNNPGMALRAGLQSQSEGGAKSAADIAALRAKEMDAARELLAQQTGKRSAVDTAGAGSSGNTFANIVGAPFAAKNAADASNQALWGTAINAGATVAASDIRGKKDIAPAPEMADAFLQSMSPEERTRLQVAGAAKEQGSPYVHADAADAFLSTLKPQQFEYKNPDGKNKKAGKRIGVMAQDLPDHDVVTGPDGKKWISADVMSDVLAGVGRLHDRVGALEGGSGAKPRPAGHYKGQVEPGNIDLTNRPRVVNQDGSTSTIRSMGVNIDGKETLIPTVSDDGRLMSDQEAIDQFKRTGKHLGKYNSVAASNAAAQALHEEQARMGEQWGRPSGQAAPQGDPNYPPMIPQQAVHDYLAGLGITHP